jgi:hypothetical protein
MVIFDDAWRKWKWGSAHAEALKASFPADARTGPFFTPTVVSVFDSQSSCLLLKVTDVGDPPPEWGLRLGDVVSNYRASLDHLAWAVVMRGHRATTLTEKEQRAVYFPYVLPRSDRPGLLRRRLPGVTDADLELIERYQPDYPAADGQPHCLSVLKEASNLDKHRSLQPMPLCVAKSRLTINTLEDCILAGDGLTFTPTDPIRPGAELGRIPVRATGPRPRAFMNGTFGLKVTVDGKIWLQEWLTEVQGFIGKLLAEFGEPPSGVLYVPPNFLDLYKQSQEGPQQP